MVLSTSLNNIDIQLIHANEHHYIPDESWDYLSEHTLFPNPFFERWNLVPAIDYLIQGEEVYLVTISKKNKIICLFPVEVKINFFNIRYIVVWKHKHCFLTDPLMSEILDLTEIFIDVGKQLKTHWGKISYHSPDIISRTSKYPIFVIKDQRPGIDNTEQIVSHFRIMKSKQKRENKRIKKKLYQHYSVTYKEHCDFEKGLETFCKIEHEGWKGKEKGSILSSNKTHNYYNHMIQHPLAKEHIIFQELRADGKAVAITIRLKTLERMYEIKTTYDEMFKHYYPGKILEIENLYHLRNAKFNCVDSCTEKCNVMISKLWPSKVKLQFTYIFYTTQVKQLFSIGYSLKKFILKHN